MSRRVFSLVVVAVGMTLDALRLPFIVQPRFTRTKLYLAKV
jgi:hypothetical protein